ncbi:TPA: hypothetical protein ACPZQD_001047 [Yersinia enterocolitica]
MSAIDNAQPKPPALQTGGFSIWSYTVKLSAELIAMRGVIASLDEQQQTKVADCHEKLKEIVDEYKDEGFIALALYMIEIDAELK